MRDLGGTTTSLSHEESLPVAASEIATCQLGELLGEGSAARVFSARSRSTATPVVLKVARDPEHEGSLLSEARVLTLVGGAYAPKLLGVGRRPDGHLALAMEHATGVSLRTLLQSSELDASARAALGYLVLVQGARALLQLHGWGVSHGDLKPDNIHVDVDAQRVTLIDLGLASSGEKVEGGTPRYLPPAVLEGKSVNPQAADVFALAMTVTEVLLPESWNAGAGPEQLTSELPDGFDEWLGSILHPLGPTPSLPWLCERVDRGDGPIDRDQWIIEEIRRSYLATRLAEIESTPTAAWGGVPGIPGRWVREVAIRLEAIRREGGERALSPSLPTGGEEGAKNLTPHDRGRFLGRLIGPTATTWQLSHLDDDALVRSLTRIGRVKSFRSLLYSDLRDDRRDAEPARPSQPPDPVTVAMQVVRRPVSRALLLTAAEHPLHPRIRLEAAKAARQRGDLDLAERLLADDDSSPASLERSVILSRRGNAAQADTMRQRAVESAGDLADRANALAAQARSLLDRGDLDAASATLVGLPREASVEEVRALIHLSRGEGEEALRVAQEAALAAPTDEALARLLGVQGMCLHFLARPEESSRHFARACELSARASSALEEATFATGWAAAATDCGHLEEALRASERAEVLFESLSLRSQAGRALLARVAVLANLGRVRELIPIAHRGLGIARQTRDRLCEAYLCFCLCDVLVEPETRLAFAQRAMRLVSDGSIDDRLRANARLISCGEKPEALAMTWAADSTSREALCDWYGARARALERLSSHGTTDDTREAGREIIAGLMRILGSGPGFFSLGPALVAGAHLALRLGFADEARNLLEGARAISDELLRHVSGPHLAAAEALTWVQQARGSRAARETGKAQLADVESLLRALSQRRGFRPLLDQTLDLLLLWTGVERGLLLLRAPGEKLVVRAARNLKRDDLTDEQRNLSLSMAKRALQEGRPVVAVDALNDISEIHRSVHALHLRSVLAVPLTARGEVLGVAYLDDRVRRGAFGERELSWVALISTIAALAISDERDRLKLERAARRARRAEKRLSEKLTDREVELQRAEREISQISGESKLRGDYSHIIGKSSALRELLQLVDRVSQSDIPALVVGESGTGKELIARAIASAGPRKDEVFIAENCSAVPEALLESTLFGHRKGAFTGATRDQLGLFELAHRGTLFLDEIGDMPLSMQAKLLRVLQDGEIRSLGAGRSREVDVRIIVATHKDLREMVELGTFREDLYYRLDVVTLRLPPLRERRQDIVLLVDHFLAKYSGDEPRSISSAALHRLSQFSWPGNVRQLENEIRRMVVLGGKELTVADLSPEVLSESSDVPEARTLKEKVDVLERRLVQEALEEARGNRTRAAAALGLSRFGLQKMIQRLQISLPKNSTKAGRIMDRGLDEKQ